MSIQSQNLASLLLPALLNLNGLSNTQTTATTAVDPAQIAKIRQAARQAAFTQADANKSGNLSLSEFKNYSIAQHPESRNLNDSSFQNLLNRLDVNHDGVLQQAEVVTPKKAAAANNNNGTGNTTNTNSQITRILLQILLLLLQSSGGGQSTGGYPTSPYGSPFSSLGSIPGIGGNTSIYGLNSLGTSPLVF